MGDCTCRLGVEDRQTDSAVFQAPSFSTSVQKCVWGGVALNLTSMSRSSIVVLGPEEPIPISADQRLYIHACIQVGSETVDSHTNSDGGFNPSTALLPVSAFEGGCMRVRVCEYACACVRVRVCVLHFWARAIPWPGP